MSPQKGKLYSSVQVTNMVDGTIVSGQEAVRQHIEHEQRLLDEHGAALIFQVYRLSLQAPTLKELQGPRLAEIKMDGSLVSDTDTVGMVKTKLRPILAGQAGLAYSDDDQLTLYCDGRPLQDDSAFYADNAILLPAWLQVLLHRCGSEEAVELINKFQP